MQVATETFVANTANGEVLVTKDVTIVDETDEVYWRYADKFKLAETRRQAPEVETATRAPGEKRGL